MVVESGFLSNPVKGAQTDSGPTFPWPGHPVIIHAMEDSDSTCWTMIQGAAAGKADAREQFALRYSPVVQSYLEARWGGTPLADNLEDAVQEVFLECFKQGGVLDQAGRVGRGGFRPFLYGVVRNIARRIESRTARARRNRTVPEVDLDAIEKREETLSKIFDRAWARSVLKEAVALMLDKAAAEDEAARRRVELLHLRFYESLPVREIARRWEMDAQTIHVAYARARREFRAALRQVAEFHNPGSPEDARKECDEIIALLT